MNAPRYTIHTQHADYLEVVKWAADNNLKREHAMHRSTFEVPPEHIAEFMEKWFHACMRVEG